MSFYTAVEPNIIDEALLKTVISMNKRPKNEDLMLLNNNKSSEEGEEKFEDLTAAQKELDLSFQDILKIDNLWLFSNITKLKLDNNMIETITNLNLLVNLEWLDLSFNKINEIKGLESLIKLQDLSLSNNRIKMLNGLDSQIETLQILSIGYNLIEEMDQLLYLSKFQKLESLNLKGNPISESQIYKSFALAFLNKLKYLDFWMVQKEEVKAAREEHLARIVLMEQAAKETAEKKLEEQKRVDELSNMDKANLGGLESLFERCYLNDPDYRRLNLIASSLIKDLIDTHRNRLDVITSELRHFVLKQASGIEDELSLYVNSVEEAKSETAKASILKISQEKETRKSILKSGKPNLTLLRANIQKLYEELMTLEIWLSEQLDDSIKDIEQNYGVLVSTLIEGGRQHFLRLREAENLYHEKMIEICTRSAEILVKVESEDLDSEIRDIIHEKDALSNILQQSHEFHLAIIEQQEETFVNGVNKNVEKFLVSITEKELERNRNRVVEIKCYIDKLVQDLPS